MVFLIDFDNTLSNNDDLKDELKDALDSVLGKEETQQFWLFHDEFRDHEKLVEFPFIIRDYCKKVYTETWETKLTEIFNNIKVKDCLYTKAVEVLTHLKSLGKVYIFTEGDLDFQKAKVNKSGLEKYVDGVYVFDYKMEKFKYIIDLLNDKITIYIDDKTYNLEQAKEAVPTVKTVWVRQGYYKDVLAINPDNIDKIVNSLDELLTHDIS